MAEAAGGVASREELAAVVDEAKPRPKPNLAAENVRDVYPLSSLVGEDILKLVPVKEWQDLVREKKEIFTNSRYVSRRVVQIANTGDVRKLRALRYLLALLDFFNASQVKGRGIRMVKPKEALRAAMPNIPEAVVENIRRKFSDGGQISRFHTDLLITHVCALALVVENFEVDTYELREDLKLEVKEITQYFRELGARVVAAGEEVRKKLDLKSKAAAAQHKIAKLKLPLDFPKAKFSRRN
jgi:DNA-directed RNA polymerase I subunit RPA49